MASGLAERKAWISILALSSWRDLSAAASAYRSTPCLVTRQPESGLVMLRGRISGTGAPFNIGEATVTRCSVKSEPGFEGHSYVMGRNTDHARLAAICDALLQDESSYEPVFCGVIRPLENLMASRRAAASRKAAATKVDFFTLVRGEVG
jgi:alpha-D-ribose 1-methylphosphonate 5-triphosphate synthase subunit PhnG